MNKEKLNLITNIILIILIIIFIIIIHHRNQLIAERTDTLKELTQETEKTNDLLIEQNALLEEY